MPVISAGENQANREIINAVQQNGILPEIVKQTAREAGFDLCGIAPVADFPELARFPQWIAQGHAGEMTYLESRDESGQLRRAAALNSIFPWARSVIVCAVNYNTDNPYSTYSAARRRNLNSPALECREKGETHAESASTDDTPPATSPSETGWISRYAWSREDYHDSVLRRLREVEGKLKESCAPYAVESRCYVDTGPIVERVYAKYAGIGWQGKNTCIINQKIGSWFFLGVIVTSLELSPDVPAPDRCGTCTRCIDACPTNAFIAPRQLDSNNCIAYLTIEKRGVIPEEFRVQIGRHVFGCDICQDVCPWNRKAPATVKPEFQPREGLVNPALAWLAEISEEEFREKFRGSPIKRAKRSGLRRNALIAIGNSGGKSLRPVTQRACNDPDSVVADAAKWAHARLEAAGREPLSEEQVVGSKED